MKKVFTLVMMMLVAGTTCVFADVDETFQFMDKDGNVLADGAEWVATEVENDGWDDMVVSGLYVKNNSTVSNPIAKLVCTIEEMPEGSTLQCCFPGNCMLWSEVGEHANGPAQYGSSNMQTEWIPASAEPGECKATFQLFYCKKKTFGDGYNETAGPTIHVTFRYGMGSNPIGSVDETFQFMDKYGNVLADGAEWLATEVENDGWDDMVVSGLYVKNNSTESNSTVKLVCTIEEMPEGSTLQCCFPGNCMLWSEVGEHANGPAQYGSSNMQTEWIPASAEPGECKATFQLFYCKKKTFGDGYNETAGPTIHVTFRYGGMSNDKIYSEDINLRSGRNGEMNIVLENEEPIIMAEFYLQLPEGVTIGTDADGNIDARLNESRCDQTHALSVSNDGNGLYHFLCYSNINKPFKDNEGELVQLRLECDENVENAVYQGLIKDILLSYKDKQSIYLNDVTFNIEVRDYLLGDINNNDIINGMDIVEIVDLIMSNSYAIAADLYPADSPDGVINGMDLVEEVELVMSQPAVQYYSPMSIMDNGLTMRPAVDGSWHLGVDKASRYILAQMTIELEKGERLIDVVSDKTHTVTWKQTDDNHYVVICYSPMNLPFSDNDELLTFICSGNGKVSISDVTLIDDTKQEFIMVDTNADLATGINDRNDDTYSSAIHDLQGRLVSNKETRSRQVTKGIYIRNNKKVVIK